MQKIYFLTFFLIFTFVFASNNLTLNLKAENTFLLHEVNIQPLPALPKNVKPAIPVEKPITPEVIKPILPDEDREDDALIQINNLRITRIVTSTPEAKAIFFAVRDVGWKCLFYASEESSPSKPCALNLRKPILQRELVIKVVDDTILLFRDRKRANLNNFQVNDKINVYGFMDKDNYGIEALIIRNLSRLSSEKRETPSLPKLPMKQPSQPPVCIQVITPAQNPQTGECKEFPIPCDVPPGWQKVDKCPVSAVPSVQKVEEIKVEADDYGFYPSELTFSKGSKVILTLVVKRSNVSNVYYGGLDFRSEKFKTEPVKPGNTTKVEFVADKSFVISSYWPLSGVKKADLQVIVK